MNRSQIETLLRDSDPAAGHRAPGELHHRTLTATVEDSAARRRIRTSSRGPLVAVAVFALIVAVVVVPAILVDRTPPTPPASSIEGATFAVRYGQGFGGIRGVATDGSRVWAMSPFEETLYEIPLDGGDIVEHHIGFYAEGVRLLGDSVWLEGWDPNQIIRVVPKSGILSNDEITTIPLPGPIGHFGIVVGQELWNAAGGALVRIAADGSVLDVREDAGIGALGLGFGAVWAGALDGDLVRLDPSTGLEVERFSLDGVNIGVGEVIAGPNSLWVMDREARVVASVLPTTGQVMTQVDVVDRPRAMTVVGSSVWVSTFDSTLVEIDAADGTILRRVAMRAAPGFLFELDGELGVSFFRSAEVALFDTSKPLVELPDGAIDDRLVEVGAGRAVRLRCMGSGSPTIVLEAEIGEGVESWATVQAMLGGTNRVCSTERSGLWMADQYPPAPSAETAAADLAAALTSAGEPGPYFLVANGVGGWVSREFAALNPGDVAGMVLVDPQPDDFLDRFAEIAPEDILRGALPGFLEGNENTRLRTMIANPAGVPTVVLGRDGLNGLFEHIGDRGVIADLERAWLDGQQATADLLDAELVLVPGVGHILYDAPTTIVETVRRLLG